MPTTPAASSLSRTARIARPSLRIRQMPDGITDQRQHGDAKGEIGLARIETTSDRPILDTPSGPWVSQIELIMTSVTICWNEIVTMAR